MNKKSNYCSPETSQTISQLGIRWKASAYWQLIPAQKRYILTDKLEPFKLGFPAYNITELGHIIPFGFFNEMKILKLVNTFFQVQTGPGTWQTFDSEVEARAHYLIYLIVSKKTMVTDIKKAGERVQIPQALPIPTKP